tara:strand:+ start:4402 stop:5229 length:828 start_codon:yes stop_codon:yes gene_type:complete
MRDKVKIIAEVGINHNGSIEIAKKLIDISAASGCDYAKFQKRTPDICVPASQKDVLRDTPWGVMKYLDYKKKIEFEKEEYDELYDYAKSKGTKIFASVWDKQSVDFMKSYGGPMKIGSALITNLDLCRHARNSTDLLIISTGMSTEQEVEACIKACDPDVIMHTNSSYPTAVEDIKLEYINWIKNHWPSKDVGYSGHEFGLCTTFASVAIGATWIERHITIDRNMWGSDQKSSVEPVGLFKLVRGIRDIEKALGGYGPRECHGSELLKRKSLRGN